MKIIGIFYFLFSTSLTFGDQFSKNNGDSDLPINKSEINLFEPVSNLDRSVVNQIAKFLLQKTPENLTQEEQKNLSQFLLSEHIFENNMPVPHRLPPPPPLAPPPPAPPPAPPPQSPSSSNPLQLSPSPYQGVLPNGMSSKIGISYELERFLKKLKKTDFLNDMRVKYREFIKNINKKTTPTTSPEKLKENRPFKPEDTEEGEVI